MFLMRRILLCVCLMMAASPMQAQKVKLLVPLDSHRSGAARLE